MLDEAGYPKTRRRAHGAVGRAPGGATAAPAAAATARAPAADARRATRLPK